MSQNPRGLLNKYIAIHNCSHAVQLHVHVHVHAHVKIHDTWFHKSECILYMHVVSLNAAW